MSTRFSLIGLVGLTVAACAEGDSPTEVVSPPVSLEIVSGDLQTWGVGQELPDPFVVRAVDDRGRPVRRELVNFRVTTGQGMMFAGASITDQHGFAQDYLTLGPDVGLNVVEVRAVDPTTGEKHVYAQFTAVGVIPGPETCNGFDDDLDGTADEGLMYCLPDGTPAPNTDGATCDQGFVDVNGLVGDGCELLVGGTWLLDPPVTLSCGFIPLGFGEITLGDVDVSVLSDTELRMEFPVQFGIAPSVTVSIDVGFSALTETFGGSSPIDVDTGLVSATGDVVWFGAFTGPGSFDATLQMSLYVVVSYSIFEFEGQCDDLDVSVTGTWTE